MFSDQNTFERLENVLYDATGIETAYVYRMGKNNKPIKPFIRKYSLDANLLMTIQREIGGGKYWLMIRNRRKLIFCGGIAIAWLLTDSRQYF